MDFDDSFFDSDSEEESKKKKGTENEKVEYYARRCEIGWFVSDSSNGVPISKQASLVPEQFMLLKYRADLLYYQKDYWSAAQLYEDTLEILPQISSLVKREILDSLTRCYLQLKEYAKAKRFAEQLVLPPHENDSSSWKLKSLCHKSLQETEAQVLSLQKCITLQCHHAAYWLELADGYSTLCQSPPFTDHSLGCDEISEHLPRILQNMVAVFRPHFSWRDKLQDMDKETPCNQEIASSVLTETSSVGNAESTNCSKCCFFYQQSQSNGHHPTDSAGSLLSSPSPLFCPLHPLFAILVSRMLSVEEFIRMLKECGTANTLELLDTLYSWATCCCYILARHLLVYSVKCSHSFAKENQSGELKRTEHLLSSCGEATRCYLETCFNQRSIFDDCRT